MRLLVWILLFTAASTTAAGQSTADLTPAPGTSGIRGAPGRPDAFWIVEGSGQLNRAMICPAHRHGTPDQAMAKLRGILRDWPADRLSTVWVCRANLLPTLKRFSPTVDQVAVNPFVHFSDAPPDDKAVIWPGVDQPVINEIREIRRVANPSTRLLACIDLRGEPNHYPNRHASFDEIQWMVTAVVGAGYEGIVWRGGRGGLAWEGRLHRLTANLQREADALGRAEPVAWISDKKGHPVSAIASENRLFICLVHPSYLNPGPGGEAFQLPLETQAIKYRITLSPPPGVKASRPRTLSGVPVITTSQGQTVLIEHRLSQGGQILVLDLTRSPGADAPAKTASGEHSDD